MKHLIILILLILPLGANGQSILKIGEVFDFEVGDEFHFKSMMNGPPPNATRLKVIEKYYSTMADTVFYKFSRDRYTTVYRSVPEPHLELFFYPKDSITNYYTNLDSSVFTIKQGFVYVGYDSITILYHSAKYCDTLINAFYFRSPGTFEPDVYTYQFGKGLGLVYEYMAYGAGMGQPSVYDVLFYYKKQNGECGTPDYTLSIENYRSTESFRIFPNPVGETLNIQLNKNETALLRLFDLNGKMHLEKRIGTSDQIDVSKLTSGIYFVNLLFADRQINRKIVIRK